MTYKEKCLEAFRKSLEEQEMEDRHIEWCVSSFSSGFNAGSVSGASEEIQNWMVEQITPKEKKWSKEKIEELRNALHTSKRV